MGRYSSSNKQGLFAHDDLAREIRHRMALDTAFFSLFPDIYEVSGQVIDYGDDDELIEEKEEQFAS